MTTYFKRICFSIALAAFAIPTTGFAEKAVAEKEEGKAGAKGLEAKMMGYWAPDPDAMLKLLSEKAGDDANAEAMLPMLKSMLSTMAFEVDKGKVNVHVMGQMQSSTYKITKRDKASKTLTMTVTDEAGAGEGTATIEGDKLTLMKDGEKVLLNRISKAEFDKRKAAGATDLPFPK